MMFIVPPNAKAKLVFGLDPFSYHHLYKIFHCRGRNLTVVQLAHAMYGCNPNPKYRMLLGEYKKNLEYSRKGPTNLAWARSRCRYMPQALTVPQALSLVRKYIAVGLVIPAK